MATGVLIVGVGKGTKQLLKFLECTKSYEATVLFGAATDTYDVLGKVLSEAPCSHITREKVERALEKFRGKIMQRPPLYSALRVQGKRLYEYARERKEVPVEIQERPVEVKELEIIEWLPPGNHHYKLRTEDAPTEEKEVADKVLHIEKVGGPVAAISRETDQAMAEVASSGTKRKRLDDENDVFMLGKRPVSERQEEDSDHCMSGGLPAPRNTELATLEVTIPPSSSDLADKDASKPNPGQPAVKLRMIVTSGFYVRSLSHDLGATVDSLGTMSELVRTRQGDFELGRNVLEYEDLGKGEEVWGPKVERMLDQWNESNTVRDRNTSSDEDQGTRTYGGGEVAVDGGVEVNLEDGKEKNIEVEDVKAEDMK